MRSSLLMRGDRQLKELKERSHNAQNSMYGEMISLQYQKDQNVVSLHGTHVQKTTDDVAMATMCPPPYDRNDLTSVEVCVAVLLDFSQIYNTHPRGIHRKEFRSITCISIGIALRSPWQETIRRK